MRSINGWERRDSKSILSGLRQLCRNCPRFSALRNLRPLNQDTGQQSGHRDCAPHNHLYASLAHLEDRWNRNNEPCNRKYHGEWIAPHHPAPVLGDVAAAHAVERDRGGQNPAQGMDNGSCY